MAGGFGVRLYPLTQNKAKALLLYRGRPLIDYLVEMVPPDMEIMVSTNRKFEADFQKWQKGIPRKVELCIEEAVTEEEKKGAVGALDYWIGQQKIKEDLLLLTGDNYFEFSLTGFLDAYDDENTLFAVYDIGDVSKAADFGVVVLDGLRVVELEEKPQNPKSSLVAAGSYVLPERVFPILHRYCSESRRDNLGSFIAHLIQVDKVYGYRFSGLWFDIGSSPELIEPSS